MCKVKAKVMKGSEWKSIQIQPHLSWKVVAKEYFSCHPGESRGPENMMKPGFRHSPE
jgi:hypothetical protein